jgi:tetratricopeptide (TPR) repeat protein
MLNIYEKVRSVSLSLLPRVPVKLFSGVKYIALALLMLICANSYAFVYGEHKRIGDNAFSILLKQCDKSASKFFFSSLGLNASSLKLSFLPTHGANVLTYGTINGLAGDHVDNPFSFFQQLADSTSKLSAILALHEEYLDHGFLAAPDKKLAKMDFRYVMLALGNKSHFYMYGKDLDHHLRTIKEDVILEGIDLDTAKAIAAFNKLNRSNPVNMYFSVHNMAIRLAAQAGKIRNEEPDKAAELIQKAILFNGFADHFLEDMFSSGHLIVNRSIFSSFTNTKALHDFYSEHGCMVTNRRGMVWKAYGDGYLSQGGEDQAVEAVHQSLKEVLEAFVTAKTSESIFKDSKILDQIPLPYSTDLRAYLPSKQITREAITASKTLPQRNFIRSRIANAIEVGRNTPSFNPNYLQATELRVNFGNFSKKYEYNQYGEKKGKLDYWHGYTASYSIGRIGDSKPEHPYESMQLLKAGLRSNYDLWLSNKRFIGITNYIETGLLFSKGQTQLAFVPSIGLQLGSLVNINYFNMPPALRIPLQWILPLQFRVGTLFSKGYKPTYFHSIDLTIAF